MTLHLVKLQPEARHLARFAHATGLPKHDQGYLWHYALRQSFGAVAPQPFRVFEPEPNDEHRSKPLHLLGYTIADERKLREALAVAPAEAAAIFSGSAVAAKELPEGFSRGRRLAFSTRVCPIVRTLSTDAKRKRELDAFVHVAAADPEAPMPDRSEVYRDWLAEKLRHGGAVLHESRLTGFRLGGLVRREHASPTGRTATSEGAPKQLLVPGRRAAARRPDATLDGVLEVVDPDRFQGLLARGVGRHRAFGFGLLLLRPAG